MICKCSEHSHNLQIMARTHAVSVEERRAARAAEKKYGGKIRKRKQATPKQIKVKLPRKPVRWKWRTVAKREIRREIRNSCKKPAIPRAAIERLIRECAPGYQFERAAMAQLRTAAEAHVVAALEAARFVADAEQVPTLDARHMHVVAAITNKMTTPTPLPEDYTISRPVKVDRESRSGAAVIVGDGGSDAEEFNDAHSDSDAAAVADLLA